MAEPLDGQPDRRRVDDRQHLGEVLGEQPVEQHLVAVPQVAEVHVPGQVVWLAPVLLVDPPQLAVHRGDLAGQQPGQPQGAPLRPGERGAPVEHRAGQHGVPAGPYPHAVPVRAVDEVVWPLVHRGCRSPPIQADDQVAVSFLRRSAVVSHHNDVWTGPASSPFFCRTDLGQTIDQHAEHVGAGVVAFLPVVQGDQIVLAEPGAAGRGSSRGSARPTPEPAPPPGLPVRRPARGSGVMTVSSGRLARPSARARAARRRARPRAARASAQAWAPPPSAAHSAGGPLAPRHQRSGSPARGRGLTGPTGPRVSRTGAAGVAVAIPQAPHGADPWVSACTLDRAASPYSGQGGPDRGLRHVRDVRGRPDLLPGPPERICPGPGGPWERCL